VPDVATRPDWDGHYTSVDAFAEPMVLFGFLSAITELELMTGVLVLPQRQTALVAKQAAQVDILSRGRFRLGVGVGWNEVEYQSLGVKFETRGARYEDRIRLLRRLWTEDTVEFQGRFDTIDRAGIAAQPVQRPIPVWMGGGTSWSVLERIGRLADGWIVMGGVTGPNDSTARALLVIREAAVAAGRDPADIGLEGRVVVGPSVNPDALRRQVEGWLLLGATHLTVHSLPRGLEAQEYTDVLHAIHAVLHS